jgi:hypothetical protein
VSRLWPRLRVRSEGQTVRGERPFAREKEVERKPAPYERPSSDGAIGWVRSMDVRALCERSRT